MKLLWGDIHNHCGITYGVGSLENALINASRQLDFCSVTPHAFWPDMPARCDETAYICDFHERGFAKIEEHWDDYISTMEKANRPGTFTTFFSFEMHSSRWGDHTFLSPDKMLRMIKKEIPAEVVDATPHKLIAIPHHIGYTPGYRGICWDGFDPEISPVIEVCSKHGCAMSDNSRLQYYHDMGPLDPRNTVYQGLSDGHRFGFIGSTDHHAGYPGSYGDGKMAVLAESNTREAIWDAIKDRRCYAVTGNKIKCKFNVNGCDMGGITERKTAKITYSVEASDAVDRIIIFRNLMPVHAVYGLSLPGSGRRYKIRIELGWGGNNEPYHWHVDIKADNGSIENVESCFRGKNFLSPTQKLNCEDESNINRPTDRIISVDEQAVSFECGTVRNVSTLHPSTSGIVLEVEGGLDTRLTFDINGHVLVRTIKELLKNGLTGHMKPYNSQAYKIHTAVPSGKYIFEGSFIDYDPGTIYHMEVRQCNGDEAFISPVFMI